MGTKESMKEIKIINTFNSDINYSYRNLNNKDSYKSLYKRDSVRRNAHTIQYKGQTNIKNSNPKLTNRKQLMTKEQRNTLKENVRENKKTIAKNLVGIFLESSKKK